MTILITGAAGFLGWNLARIFAAEGHDVIGCWHRSSPDGSLPVTWKALDLADPGLADSVGRGRFDCLINCAAIAGLKTCDENPELARRINSDAPGILAGACLDRDIPFLHISTDLVFDGRKGWYMEDDPVSPASLYAETKVLSEQSVMHAHPGAYVLRTALMYGVHKDDYGGFLSWTCRALENGTGLQLFTNQFRTALYADDVTRAVAGLLHVRPAAGIYHLAGPDRLSRLEIGTRAAQSFFGSTQGIRSAVFRPEEPDYFDDVSLRTDKIRSALGMSFTPMTDAYREIRARLDAA